MLRTGCARTNHKTTDAALCFNKRLRNLKPEIKSASQITFAEIKDRFVRHKENDSLMKVNRIIEDQFRIIRVELHLLSKIIQKA